MVPVLTARSGVKPFIFVTFHDQRMISAEAATVTSRHGSLVDGKLVRTKIDTPLGSMVAVADDAALHLLEFENRVALTGEVRRLERNFGLINSGSNNILEMMVAQFDDYFAGKFAAFKIPTFQRGTVLEEAVWQALKQIPPGQTRSYGDIARIIGQPDKSREVGRANGANNMAIVVPCHRVIGADGSLVGYGGGLWRKRWLLDHERRYAWASYEHKSAKVDT
jgi:AraC family transcriptional regulator, regulatory protein of adaptative response / methylated-DNA-[protein]-cysteine methyltransferase